MKTLRGKLSYANVMATIAVFIAIGGTAVAVDGPLAGQNTVGSEDIIGNEVKSDDIGNGRIFNLDIADEIITGQKLKDGTVTGDDVDESSFDGNIRTPGLIRLGNETGTTDLPNVGNDGSYNGVVVRRINSENGLAGNVVARSDGLRLERDGTIAGLRIAWNANPGADQSATCVGVDSAGAVTGFHNNIGNPATAGTVTVFTNAQNIVKVDCHFGNAHEPEATTAVQLIRFAGDNGYIGFVTSTFNQ